MKTEAPKYIDQAGPYIRKGDRPFLLVIQPYRAEYAVFKVFQDDKEPKEEYVMAHHLAGCGKCFEIRAAALDKIYGQDPKEYKGAFENGNGNGHKEETPEGVDNSKEE